MKYLLDTDTVSYALRQDGRVAEQIKNTKPGKLGISSITLAELRLGARRKASSRIHSLIDIFALSVRVVSFDAMAAEEFARIGSFLMKNGIPIGQLDTLIAAHAISLDSILVTNNTRHFSRVPGLKLENWT